MSPKHNNVRIYKSYGQCHKFERNRTCNLHFAYKLLITAYVNAGLTNQTGHVKPDFLNVHLQAMMSQLRSMWTLCCDRFYLPLF